MERVRVKIPARPRVEYEIKIGARVLSELGTEARRVLQTRARRVVIVSNPKVFALYGESARESLRAADFRAEILLIGEGERQKSLRVLGKVLDTFSRVGLERSNAVIALGGGVVGDLAGFAASVYLRGVDFIQAPTTLLSQVDASVGGKTAINLQMGKNLVGAFHQPRAVLIDTDTLETLPRRELTAGWCESVKQGAAGDRELFDETYGFLREKAANRAKSAQISNSSRLEKLIAAQCAFKAKIVAGDEREDVSRTDHLSRRILNFGHTIAHALENVTAYRRFRHGEAVGYGMLAAGEISKRLGMMPPDELELLRAAVQACGRLPRADDLSPAQLLSAARFDKKVAGGQLKWVLLERLGRARVVDSNEIPPRALSDSLRAALKFNS